MVRAALLLLIVAGLVIFTLQNLSPLSLVILGVQTQPLPLALWIVGAIAAGTFTSILTAGLFKASNLIAPSRARRPPAANPSSSRQTSTSPHSSRSSSWQAEPTSGNPPSGYASTASSRKSDDWEQRQPPLEDWEDWEGYEEPPQPQPAPSRPVNPQRYSRAEPQDYSSTEPYTRFQPDIPPTPVEEREEWDDWDDDAADFDPVDRSFRQEDEEEERYRRDRTDFEVKQEPKTHYQEGSIYSYSYRDPNDSDAQIGKTENVYDAEYRVITPPYKPDVEPPVSERPDDEEEWDEDNQRSDRGDRIDRKDKG